MAEITTLIHTTSTERIGVSCIICGEFVELSEYDSQKLYHGLNISPQVCDKCRAAIMKIRSEMEADKKN